MYLLWQGSQDGGLHSNFCPILFLNYSTLKTVIQSAVHYTHQKSLKLSVVPHV